MSYSSSSATSSIRKKSSRSACPFQRATVDSIQIGFSLWAVPRINRHHKFLLFLRTSMVIKLGRAVAEVGCSNVLYWHFGGLYDPLFGRPPDS